MLDSIKFIVWNIRGASNKESLRHIHFTCRSNNIRLLILLEPLANVSHLENVQLFLGLILLGPSCTTKFGYSGVQMLDILL